MPQMGVSVAEGTVVEWKKQVGDWVEADEVIASISTDKIDTDVEAPAAGRLQEIVVGVGETVDVGTVLALIATDAKPGEAHQSESSQEAGEEAGEEEREEAKAEPVAAQSESDSGSRSSRRYSPVVMRMAAEHDLDLDQIEGSGRGGRVRKQDVLAYLENGASKEAPMHIESPYRPDEPAAPKKRQPRFTRPDEPAPAPAPAAAAGSGPLSRMRQSIGRAMVESLRTAATCTTIVEADMSRVEAARKSLGVTYLPVIARATIETLREFPGLNATLEGDALTTYEGVHLGVAVSLGQGGLIVPV